jgi:hypothetical protein
VNGTIDGPVQIVSAFLAGGIFAKFDH